MCLLTTLVLITQLIYTIPLIIVHISILYKQVKDKNRTSHPRRKGPNFNYIGKGVATITKTGKEKQIKKHNDINWKELITRSSG